MSEKVAAAYDHYMCGVDSDDLVAEDDKIISVPMVQFPDDYEEDWPIVANVPDIGTLDTDLKGVNHD